MGGSGSERERERQREIERERGRDSYSKYLSQPFLAGAQTTRRVGIQSLPLLLQVRVKQRPENCYSTFHVLVYLEVVDNRLACFLVICNFLSYFFVVS